MRTRVITGVLASLVLGAAAFLSTNTGRGMVGGWMRKKAGDAASQNLCEGAARYTVWAERLARAGAREYQRVIHCFFHREDYAGAHQALQSIWSVTKGREDKSALKVAMAEVYEMQKECLAQRREAKEATGYDETNADAYVLLATSYGCAADPLNPAADEALTKALELNPNHARALNAKGVVHMYRYDQTKNELDFQQGVSFFTRATKENPNEWRPHYNFGVDYFLFKQDYSNAIRYLEQFSALIDGVYDGRLKGADGSVVETNAYYYLSAAYNASGQFEKSLMITRRLQKIILRDPSVLERVERPTREGIDKLIKTLEANSS